MASFASSRSCLSTADSRSRRRRFSIGANNRHAFARIAAFSGGTATFAGSDGPERVATGTVSWDLFDLLKVSPILGRTFTEAEDLPGKNGVIVLSYGMWQRRFAGDPGVLGRTLTLSGEPVTIVGVMPADFFFPAREIELWRPIALNPANATRGGHFLAVIARLKTGRLGRPGGRPS